MSKQEEQFNLRVPKELKEWVRKQAEAKDRSMNYIALKLMEKGRKMEEVV